MFLNGVFEEKARLLQWVVFFVSSTRSVHFCALCTFIIRYFVLVLNASKALGMKYKTILKQKGTHFQLFRLYETFPLFGFCETFFRKFLNVSKGSPLFFDFFATNWIFKKPPPSTTFDLEIFQNEYFSSKIYLFQWPSNLYPYFVFFLKKIGPAFILSDF